MLLHAASKLLRALRCETPRGRSTAVRFDCEILRDTLQNTARDWGGEILLLRDTAAKDCEIEAARLRLRDTARYCCERLNAARYCCEILRSLKSRASRFELTRYEYELRLRNSVHNAQLEMWDITTEVMRILRCSTEGCKFDGRLRHTVTDDSLLEAWGTLAAMLPAALGWTLDTTADCCCCWLLRLEDGVRQAGRLVLG